MAKSLEFFLCELICQAIERIHTSRDSAESVGHCSIKLILQSRLQELRNERHQHVFNIKDGEIDIQGGVFLNSGALPNLSNTISLDYVKYNHVATYEQCTTCVSQFRLGRENKGFYCTHNGAQS